MINRRKFILSSTLLGGALNTNFSRAEKVDLVNTKIGNTDLVVPNIGLGSSSTDNPSVIRHAFDRGVRYFDTAESYMGGRAEKAIGNALKDEISKGILARKGSSPSTQCKNWHTYWSLHCWKFWKRKKT